MEFKGLFLTCIEKTVPNWALNYYTHQEFFLYSGNQLEGSITSIVEKMQFSIDVFVNYLDFNIKHIFVGFF